MKKFLLIGFLFMGSLFFLQSCSPYYYDRSYGRSYAPPPRVIVTPRPYYAPPPPAYRYKRHHHRERGYRRY